MPREQRDWQTGDRLSIVGRGQEGRPHFASDDDRRFFVERLGRMLRPGDVDLRGWALRTAVPWPGALADAATTRGGVS